MTTFMLHFNNSPSHGYLFWSYGAAGKYHHDRELFAAEIGIQRMDAYMYQWDDEPRDVLNARIDGIIAGLKVNDTVIIQWQPAKIDPRWLQTLFDHIHGFGAHIVLLIDDMLSWRAFDFNPNDRNDPLSQRYVTSPTVQLELQFIPQAQGIIAHSDAMLARMRAEMSLVDQKMTTNTATYGPGGNASVYFQPRRTVDQGVDYAGNLIYAKFLYELPEAIQLNVYGASPDEFDLADHPNISLTPRVDPEAINQLLKGSFGLVWSSDSYPEATGPIARYMHYNTSAKLSMYLAADEPVIVWSQASFAPFVRDNGIGLVIDDLTQLPEVLAHVSADDYIKMLDNVQRISPQIRNGFFIKRAIFDVLAQIYDQSLPEHASMDQ